MSSFQRQNIQYIKCPQNRYTIDKLVLISLIVGLMMKPCLSTNCFSSTSIVYPYLFGANGGTTTINAFD